MTDRTDTDTRLTPATLLAQIEHRPRLTAALGGYRAASRRNGGQPTAETLERWADVAAAVPAPHHSDDDFVRELISRYIASQGAA